MTAAPMSGVGLAKSACESVACLRRSGNATTEASEVSLMMDTRLLVCGGTATLRACGRITLSTTCQNCRPSASAASVWPLGTLWMPARNTSAVKAESTITRARLAEVKDEKVTPTKGRA